MHLFHKLGLKRLILIICVFFATLISYLLLNSRFIQDVEIYPYSVMDSYVYPMIRIDHVGRIFFEDKIITQEDLIGIVLEHANQPREPYIDKTSGVILMPMHGAIILDIDDNTIFQHYRLISSLIHTNGGFPVSIATHPEHVWQWGIKTPGSQQQSTQH